VTTRVSSGSALSGATPPLDASEALRRLAAIAQEVGGDQVLAEAAALGERLAEGRFFVACVGQFKRGKSTLINALVGVSVLPTGVVPVTSVVTVVRHGAGPRARVRLGGRAWQEIHPATLPAYVAEEQNPENEKAVDAVEVFVPSPLLATGMCLVDTPGVGSVFAASTRTTRDFVPHIDAGLVVLGADPPLAGDELTLVEAAAQQTDRLLFVLNKADRLSAAERAEARGFAERILRERLCRPLGRIFDVSATEALAGRPGPDWTALVGTLDELARQSGTDLVRDAAERGMNRLADRLGGVIAEHRDALVRPLDASERRLAALRQAALDAERALADLAPLFAGEQASLARALTDEREAFVVRAAPEAVRRLDEALARSDQVAKRGLRHRALEDARRIAHEVVTAWLLDVEPRAEELYRRATGRFTELANDFLACLRTTGDGALSRLPASIPPEARFRVKRQFYFTELLTIASPDPATWLVGLLGPRRLARAAARRDAAAYLDRLVRANGARVANDLIDRVAESRRRLEAELAALLREVATSAERALERARERHAAGAEAIRAELDRLDALRDRLLALRRKPES
jgi:hypothetical protein